MNTKSFLFGTIAGAVGFFLSGYLLYGILLSGFFEANAGSATGVMKDSPDWAFLFAGEIAWGALYTYIFLQWANIKTLSTGVKAGAIIGLLGGLGNNLIWYATSNLSTMTGSLVDALVSMVMGAIAGGVIGFVLGKVSE